MSGTGDAVAGRRGLLLGSLMAPGVLAAGTASAAGRTRLGLNLAGGAAGESVLPGQEGVHYRFPDAIALEQAAECGARVVRVDFRWERVQAALGGPLDEAHLGRLRDVAGIAAARGIGVVWNLHNYGRRIVDGRPRIIGDADGAVSRAQFADVWHRLATALRDLPATHAYGLMNEPHDMPAPGHWAASAQAAVDAVAAADPRTLVYVAGDGWSSARFWRDNNEALRIHHPDPGRVVYEAHQYDDPASNFSGTYRPADFDVQDAVGRVRGHGGADAEGYAGQLRPFLDWLAEHGLRGAIGECGVPDDDPRWTAALAGFVRAGMAARLDSVILWAHAPFFGPDYELQLAPDARGTRRGLRMLRELSRDG